MVQKVSVIVPVYNAESTIGKCLDSIEGQDYSNLEIILINDGSKDKSEDVCKKYCEKYKNIVYIYQDNQGVSSARNCGLRIATGEYISFVDPDDYIASNMISSMISYMKIKKCEIVSCNYFMMNKEGIDINCNSQESCILDKTNAMHELLQIGASCIVGHVWDKIFKKEVIENIFFDEKIHCYEDLEFVFKAFMKCNNIFYLNEKLYYYIISDMSIMNNSYNIKRHTFIKALEDLEKICLLSKDFDLINRCKVNISNNLVRNALDLILCNIRIDHKSEMLVDLCSALRKNGSFLQNIGNLVSIKRKIICIMLYLDYPALVLINKIFKWYYHI